MMPLIPPIQLRQELVLAQQLKDSIAAKRCEIEQILTGKDPRLLLIVGPCSIHDIASTLEYGQRLRHLGEELKAYFLPIMRVYYEKPRTITGWKGFAQDPHLDGSYDIATGIRLTRELLLRLVEMQLPLAAEFLDPFSVHYFSDLIAWGCIGARTVESQIHRQMASMLPMPIAFKNSTSGNIDVAIHAILAASMPHRFIGIDQAGQLTVHHSSGNTFSHLVLRGGEKETNFDQISIEKAIEALRAAKLPTRLLVDCSHDNSKRKHELQPCVFHSVIEQVAEGNTCIRGLLLESHLNGGCQELPLKKGALKYAVSLTDPCLNWEATESTLRAGCQRLAKARAQEIDSTLSLAMAT